VLEHLASRADRGGADDLLRHRGRTVSGGKEATPCRIDGDYIGSRINPQRRHQA
jgi:hypothetical protein